VKLFVLLLPVALMGCQSTNPTLSLGTEGSPSFCATAKAIYYSRHDTKPTIQQIREHNAVGMALKCGWLKK
jgi:hypothetical protein